MRLFTAIDIAPDVRATMAALIHRLRPMAKLGWIPAEKLHITTKFIGEWPEERLDEMKRVLGSVRSSAPVEIAIRRVGWLPNPRSARMLYAGVEPNDGLSALAAATEQAAAGIGVPVEERIYRPHVTLARIRKRVPLGPLKDALAEFELSSMGSYRALSFALYLSAAGTYTKLQEFPLNT